MLKRITVALAGIFATLGLVATPAASGLDTELAGRVQLFENKDRDQDGRHVTILEADIPDACEAIPSELDAVRSAQNDTTGPGTSVSFYTNSSCTMGEETVLPNGGFDDEINLPSGALFWRSTP